MRRIRFVTMVMALAAVAALLAACGSDEPASAGGSTGATAAGGATGSTGTAGGMAGSISTAEAPGVGTVLVNAEGYTLYYLMTDEASKVTCTGDCLANWPPALADQAPSAGDLPKDLGTIEGPKGTQLTYDGWPLYTFVGDTAPGQANGQDVGDVWYAMTPDGAKAGAATQQEEPRY